MLDYRQSLFVHLNFPLKFRVDRVRTFLRYRDSKISQIWLQVLIQPLPQNYVIKKFWLSKHYFLLSRLQKSITLRGSTCFEV